MNWLRKFWDEYSWLFFLPMILIVGIFLSLAIVGIRFGVVYVFQNVPFFVWGSFVGTAFLFFFVWYLKEKIIENKGVSWSLSAQISPISIVFGAIGLMLLTASVVWILMPETAKTFWEIVQNVGFLLIVSLVFYAFIFVCGEFIAQGIILVRSGVFSGSFLILIALVGIAPIFLKLYDLLILNYLQKNWISTFFFSFIVVLIIAFLTIYSIIPAFQYKKDEPI